MKWIFAIAHKEARHIMRDWQTLGILLLLPVFMMFFFGYALNSDVEEAPVVLIDPSPSAESRSIAASLDASTLFHVIAVLPSGDPVRELRHRHAKAVIRLSPDFASQLQSGGTDIQVLIDGSDPSTGTMIRNAVGPFFQDRVLRLLGQEPPQIVTISNTVLYNPEQKSSFFFVPGLMATLLLMVGALMTSIAIVRERETGTLASILTSPTPPVAILIGKVLPFVCIATADAVLILGVGRFVFEVVVSGSLWFLAAASILYILVALSIGILISTLAHRQQHAMMISLAVTMMPTIMLSGFVFPIASMPQPLQWLSLAMPARWFLLVVRGIVLKANGPADLWLPLVVLAGMALLFLAAATRRFRVQE